MELSGEIPRDIALLPMFPVQKAIKVVVIMTVNLVFPAVLELIKAQAENVGMVKLPRASATVKY